MVDMGEAWLQKTGRSQSAVHTSLQVGRPERTQDACTSREQGEFPKFTLQLTLPRAALQITKSCSYPFPDSLAQSAPRLW